MFIKKYILIFLILLSTMFSNEIRIITNEEPPTNYKNKGELVGITVDVVKELIKQMKLDTEIEYMTWARAYNIGKSNKDIILFTAGKTYQRIEEGFKFLGPVMTKNALLYKNANNDIQINSLLDISKNKLKIGAMRGDWRAHFFMKKGFNVQEVSNHEQNIQKLLNGRFDLWAISRIEAQFIAKKAKVDISEISEAYAFKEISSFIMFSKGTSKQTIRAWERAYKELQKTDFFEKTARKWSRILQINLEYDKHKGFLVK